MRGLSPLCPLLVAPWGPHPRTISRSIPFQLHAIGPLFYVTVQLQIREGQPDIPLECPQDSSDSTSLKQKSSSSLQPCMNGTSFQKPEFSCPLLTHPPHQVLPVLLPNTSFLSKTLPSVVWMTLLLSVLQTVT